MKLLTRKSALVPLIAWALSGATSISAGNAYASDRRITSDRFTEFADVVDVQPVYKNIRVREPRQECWVETRQRIVGYEAPRYERHQAHRSERSHSAGGVVVGGLIGGVIGNQLGRGHSSGSRAGATIAGAIIGSAVGNEARGNVSRHRNQRPAARRGAPIYQTEEIERCKEVSESRLEQRIQHYDVTYRYKGRTFTTRTKRDPGRQIELQVSISPARH
ncbi:MAG: glycine zipper 2TM domain-containing protein [Granulosicoccus sp.]